MMESLCAENPIKISRKTSKDWNTVKIRLSTICYQVALERYKFVLVRYIQSNMFLTSVICSKTW